jgi:tetratricopeptide (TPR) repeat protein
VDRSIVSTLRDQGKPLRYSLLEPLKQYASGLLDIKETKRIKRKHLDYYIHMAEKAYDNRYTSQEFWMSRLSLEHGNMMAALNWASHNNFTQYACLAGLLGWFWTRSNKIHLAGQILGVLMESGIIRNETKARVQTAYGWSLAGQFDQYPYLMELGREIPLIWHRLGNKKEEVVARTDLATIYFGVGNDDAGVQTIMETYEMAKDLDDRGVLLYCMGIVSQGLVATRRFEEARSFIKKYLELADELGNVFAKFSGHHNYGDCALMEGKFKEAATEYGEGIKITLQFGDMPYLFTDLAGVAMAVAGMGRHAKALRLISGVNRASKKAGMMSPEYSPLIFWHKQIILHIEGTREKLGEILTRKYEAEGATMELEEVIEYALDFDKD